MRAIRTMLVAGATLLASIITIQPAVAWGSPDLAVTCGGLVAYNEMRSNGPQYGNPLSGNIRTSQIKAIPAVGGTPRVIWDDPAENHGEIDAAWSPDGRSVAFVGVFPGGPPAGVDSRLYVLRAGASEPEVLVEQVARNMRHPAWSPDGMRIAYLTSQEPPDRPYQSLSWVNVVDVASKQVRFLTVVPLTTQRALDLNWSPRGNQLLFTAWQLNTGNWSIYSAPPTTTTTNPTPLISNDPDRKPLVLTPVLRPAPEGEDPVRLPVMEPAFLPGGYALLVEHEGSDEASTGLELTDPGFGAYARVGHALSVGPAEGFNSQPDFGLSPLQAVYHHRNGDESQSSIVVLTLPTGGSRTLVKPIPAQDGAPGTLLEQPDWQPVVGCRPWPFAT